MTTPSSPERPSDREIVVSRIVAAPRELVWEVWTNPEHVAKWWGPRGFTTTIERMDLRPGGVWKHVMRGPDGTEYPGTSVFREVLKPKRIVLAHSGGKAGGPGVQFVGTWTFEAVGPNQTRVTIRMEFKTPDDCETVIKVYGAIEGGKQTLERLDGYLPSVQAGGR